MQREILHTDTFYNEPCNDLCVINGIATKDI